MPDVSFFADTEIGYAVYCTTEWTGDGWHVAAGTSAVPRLGLLGPVLYRLARQGSPGSVLTDVTGGDNDLFALGCCAAAPGHDRATGLGSLRLDAFARAAARARAR